MAEIATIARPYAEALFKALPGAATLVWLDELASIAAAPQLQEFAASPNAQDEQVYGVFVGVAKTQLEVPAQNFLRTVIAHNRLAFLPEIARQFRALVNTQAGSCDATLYSAFPIEAEALAATALLLEQRFARKLNVALVLEPELIGGIRVVVGDEVLDSSVKARLEQMKVALTA